MGRSRRAGSVVLPTNIVDRPWVEWDSLQMGLRFCSKEELKLSEVDMGMVGSMGKTPSLYPKEAINWFFTLGATPHSMIHWTKASGKPWNRWSKEVCGELVVWCLLGLAVEKGEVEDQEMQAGWVGCWIVVGLIGLPWVWLRRSWEEGNGRVFMEGKAWKEKAESGREWVYGVFFFFFLVLVLFIYFGFIFFLLILCWRGKLWEIQKLRLYIYIYRCLPKKLYYNDN